LLPFADVCSGVLEPGLALRWFTPACHGCLCVGRTLAGSEQIILDAFAA